MAAIVHTPKRHRCDPGWTRYVIHDSEIPELDGRIGLNPPSTGTPEGSVWECVWCGKTWVAHYPKNRNAVVLSPSFRPEGRIERWRRERREGS